MKLSSYIKHKRRVKDDVDDKEWQLCDKIIDYIDKHSFIWIGLKSGDSYLIGYNFWDDISEMLFQCQPELAVESLGVDQNSLNWRDEDTCKRFIEECCKVYGKGLGTGHPDGFAFFPVNWQVTVDSILSLVQDVVYQIIDEYGYDVTLEQLLVLDPKEKNLTIK